MTAMVRHMLGMAMLLVLTTAAMAADKAIIVLDASGSMWGQIDGRPKIEIARETLRRVLQVDARRLSSWASWPMATARRAIAPTSS